MDKLSIILIGPDEQCREAVASALAQCAGSEVHSFSSYPPSLDDATKLLEQNHAVIIIDLDSNPEYALDLVESIGANGSSTVMVYSAKADPDLLVRCMRAGAREFLMLPLEPGIMEESLVRASARRPAVRPTIANIKKSTGRLLTFMGAKGGTGVTTLACNFAVALAQNPEESTLLIDLDLPFGDAALNLGISAEFSTIDALQSSARLDGSFLSRLLVKHSSGVSVLAAPGRFQPYQAANEAIDKLIQVARQDFDNVVVDMGSRVDLTGSVLFKNSSAIYLVTQAGIPELRNSNRLISQFFSDGGPKLEVVINRHEPSVQGVTEKDIAKALGRPAKWKIPNDYAAVRRMQIDAAPLTLGDSPISRQIQQMARAASGQPALEVKKKSFKLFG
ncbi:MAG: AAA family ATPase [Acidobacteriaceae bacterium]|nr:AAA family ATPase [Acidobacteriaceae bacterium]